jgi:hypothetical protein
VGLALRIGERNHRFYVTRVEGLYLAAMELDVLLGHSRSRT